MLSYTSKGTGEGEAVAAATENILFSGVVYLSPHNTNYPQCSNHTKAGHLCCVVCCVFFFSVCFTLNVILLYSSFDSSIHWRNNEKKVNGCNKAFFFFFFPKECTCRQAKTHWQGAAHTVNSCVLCDRGGFDSPRKCSNVKAMPNIYVYNLCLQSTIRSTGCLQAGAAHLSPQLRVSATALSERSRIPGEVWVFARFKVWI